MATLQDLIAQKAELEKQIEELHTTSRRDAIAQIKALMEEHGLSGADLETGRKKPAAKSSASGTKVAAKYRNEATGDTWSGRGLKPKWLKAELDAGRNIEDFAV
jgi:DNA-binding protein H-NS